MTALLGQGPMGVSVRWQDHERIVGADECLKAAEVELDSGGKP